MLLSLLMITSYITIFASYKRKTFKLSFNSIAVSDSRFRFPLSKNIATKEPLILSWEWRSTSVPFPPSKYNLIVKLKPEVGLANRFLCVHLPVVNIIWCCYYPESQHSQNKSLSLFPYLQSWKYFHK